MDQPPSPTPHDPPLTKTDLRAPPIALLGLIGFGALLAWHNIADGDLWARLAQGAALWQTHHLPPKDPYAFTPVLGRWVDHEWGAGLIFYSLLKGFGPDALMLCKIVCAYGALGFALAAGRRHRAPWPALLLLAIPAATALLPGYVPVIRSHAFTFLFFAATLFFLEEIRRGGRWPALALAALMLAWANIHGGFVAGLGAMAVYTFWALAERRRGGFMLGLLALCLALSLVNPWGWRYWQYLIPALRHKRPDIAEWRPMALWGWDAFIGFRVLAALVVAALASGWRGLRDKRAGPGLTMLALTAWLAFASRRHAPFFALAALVWSDARRSALFARGRWLAPLRQAASELPPGTPEPLDAKIPQDWLR